MELKHIVGYLPYGLNGIIKGKIVTLTSLHQNSLETRPSVHRFTYCEFNHFTPILRPLSDLTKEIEVNGEKFVPITLIDDLFPDFYIEQGNEKELIIKYKNSNMYVDIFRYAQIIEKLYEWYFDLHNLIEKGEAIDINQLK